MASVLQVNEIKDSGGNATGITVADSSANVTINNLAAGTIGSSVVFPAGGTGNAISVAVIADEKANNTAGGNSDSDANFVTRNLNTEICDPDSIVSISSNQFTLGAGTYLINWSAPAYNSNEHQSQLYNVTGTTTLELGGSMYADTGDAVITRSEGSFVHTISSNNVYEIKHRVAQSQSGNGLGIAINFSTVNIYTYVVITKLK